VIHFWANGTHSIYRYGIEQVIPMSNDDPGKTSDDGRAGARAIAERDAKIEQLERSIAEEREHTANLRSTVNELRFQAEILEKSYSNQLKVAREQSEAAEKKSNEQLSRIAELDSARKDAITLLTDAKAEIDRLTTERNQLNRHLASRDGWQVEDSSEDDELSAEGTINTLLDDAKWVRDKQPDAAAVAKAEAEARAAEEALAEEMISPDLVFTAKAADS
jgi:chromosome segregation ATPase